MVSFLRLVKEFEQIYFVALKPSHIYKFSWVLIKILIINSRVVFPKKITNLSHLNLLSLKLTIIKSEKFMDNKIVGTFLITYRFKTLWIFFFLELILKHYLFLQRCTSNSLRCMHSFVTVVYSKWMKIYFFFK